MNKPRFIVGIILVAIAVLIFLFDKNGYYSIVGAIGLGVLGLISIALSRKRK